MTISHLYTVYGICIRSEIKFWEFSEISSVDTCPDSCWAQITFGEVPERVDGGWIMVRGNECLFDVRGKGRILVSNGDRIVVDLDDARFEEDIKPYLIICGITALAHQRGLVPLHVSALRSPEGVFLFAGPSGAGKSTIAATLNARYGWVILCDDLAVLDTANFQSGTGAAMLHFGMNKIKLWDDAAKTLGIASDGVQRDYFRPHKLHLPVPASDPIPFSAVRAVVCLRWGEDIRISKRSAVHSFATLMNSIYPTLLVGPISDITAIRKNLARISEGLATIDFQRSKKSTVEDALADFHNLVLDPKQV